MTKIYTKMGAVTVIAAALMSAGVYTAPSADAATKQTAAQIAAAKKAAAAKAAAAKKAAALKKAQCTALTKKETTYVKKMNDYAKKFKAADKLVEKAAKNEETYWIKYYTAKKTVDKNNYRNLINYWNFQKVQADKVRTDYSVARSDTWLQASTNEDQMIKLGCRTKRRF